MLDEVSVDVDLTLMDKPPEPGLIGSRTALAIVALRRALGPTGRRLLKDGRAKVAIILVPTSQWVEPIATATRLLAGKDVTVVTKAKADDLFETLSNGETAVG